MTRCMPLAWGPLNVVLCAAVIMLLLYQIMERQRPDIQQPPAPRKSQSKHTIKKQDFVSTSLSPLAPPSTPLPMPQLKEKVVNVNFENLNFAGALQAVSKPDRKGNRVVILSSVDSAYLPMALNLYETSFLRLGLTNYLFMCSDTAAYKELRKHGINAYDYIHDKDSIRPSNFGTAAYRRKTHYKTKMILDALRLGMTVLIMDLDIVLFKDPFPYFRDCEDCDIQIQTDIKHGNSGFYLARPTKAAIQLHQSALDIAMTRGEKVSNQQALWVMEDMVKNGTIKVKTLSKALFPPCCNYVEDGRRMFHYDNRPKQEVLVHYNWIISMEAKIYSFKEQLQWVVDTGGYYSDPHRKYLTYNNPLDFGNNGTMAEENSSLQTALALAHILNRTLILPAFTCRHCNSGACKVTVGKCSFYTHYRIPTFDQYFKDRYREHVFLDHPKVPGSIKNRKYETYLIMVDKVRNLIKLEESFKQRTPKDSKRGATVEEIAEWFGSMDEPVLRLHSLYGAFGGMDKMDKTFREMLQKALKLRQITDFSICNRTTDN